MSVGATRTLLKGSRPRNFIYFQSFNHFEKLFGHKMTLDKTFFFLMETSLKRLKFKMSG